MGIGNNGKVGPDRAIQKTPSNRFNDRRNAHDIDPMPFSPKNEVVGKKRDSQDMIKMGVSNEDMLDFQLTLDLQGIGKAPRVKQDAMV